MAKNPFVRHYHFILTTSQIAVMALLIFIMNIPRGLQIGLLVVSALVFPWALRYRGSHEAPCGLDIGGEAIARPRPGFEP